MGPPRTRIPVARPSLPPALARHARSWQQAAGSRQQAAGSRQQAAGSRQLAAGSRQLAPVPLGHLGIAQHVAACAGALGSFGSPAFRCNPGSFGQCAFMRPSVACCLVTCPKVLGHLGNLVMENKSQRLHEQTALQRTCGYPVDNFIITRII